MPQPAGTSLLERFAALEDPRQAAKVLFYPLPEILLLLSAILAGADACVRTSSGATSSSPSCAASCLTSAGFQVTTP
jgi:hypothetical protein